VPSRTCSAASIDILERLMPANPAAMFSRPRVHVSLLARPYERRCVLVIPSSDAAAFDPRNPVDNGTFFTRGKVADAVARGEMRWCDKFHNTATYTDTAAGTWQKTRSGPVCTMQLKVGLKGRHVPAGQREPELVLE
jgi:hypothetical protein